MRPERLVRCGHDAPRKGSRRLTLDIDGKASWATLDLGALARRLVSGFPDRVQDAIEIAAWIYAADAMISRGDETDPEVGRGWRRRMRFVMPVRDAAFWSRPEIGEALSAVVATLSDDDCSFDFEAASPDPIVSPGLPFDPGDGFRPEATVLFSGGLDSLAGALEELVARKTPVLLVSHRSAFKVQRVQDELVRELAKLVGQRNVMHAPIGLNLKEGTTRESTHRTRSLFFAVAAAAIGDRFGLDRVRFFENGVVSLNLPPSGQVIGTRATRSTHPQALARLEALFAPVFGRKMRVDNPFFWKTKAEVVRVIRDLGGRGLIRATRSCADVRNMTVAYSHCGLCSQCIDRRFAMHVERMEEDDPEEAYEVDPLFGPRTSGPSREIALGYVRIARRFATMSPGAFLAAFGEAQRALDHIDGSADAALRRLIDLHGRHGAGVSQALEREIGAVMSGTRTADPQSLVRLAGLDLLSGGDLPAPAPTLASAPAAASVLVIRIGPRRDEVAVDGLGVMKGVSAKVVLTLAESWLEAAGRGLAPEDHLLLRSHVLADRWCVDEPTVRKRISGVRTALTKLATEKGREPPEDDAVIENIAWKGYRLNPDRVRVIRTDAR